MKKLNFCLIALALAACTSGSGSSSGPVKATIKNAHPGVGEIYVIGDSLAVGYHASSPSLTPSGCLADFFHQKVQSLAQPGLTSDLILRQAQDVQTAGAKLVFVSTGGNDALIDSQAHNYPASRTLEETAEIFDDLLATGAVVVYLGLDPHRPGAERLPQVSVLAASKGVLVVDGMNGFWDDPEYMSQDQIHPNDHGYAVMCSRLLDAVKGSYP
jgi:lysophospholipase L1-like esterase